MMMNSDGSGQQELHIPNIAHQQYDDDSPSWSPNGQQIAYGHTNVGGNGLHDIYSFNVGTAADTPLTTGGYEWDAAWSPNGQQIVYDVVDPATGGYQLYIMNADGTNPQIIGGSNSGYSDYYPTWAPNGQRIYFVSSEGDGVWYYDLTNGSNDFTSANVARHQLTTSVLPGNCSGGGRPIGVSADSGTITYSAQDSSNVLQIWTIPASGGTSTPKTSSTDSSNSTPAFVQNAWPTATTKNLVALGDSVAAGEGINYGYKWNSTSGSWEHDGPDNPAWMDTTNAAGANYQQCHQSGMGYADQFRLNGDNYHVYNMACTGASALQQVDSSNNPTLDGGVLDNELFNSSDQPYPENDGPSASTETVPAQLGGSCSGCAASNLYFTSHVPDVVTLTVGANDLDFPHWIKKCYNPLLGDCNTTDNTNAINDELSHQSTNLGLVLTELNQRASQVFHKTVRVLVTNYYNPFPSDPTSCVDTDGAGSYPNLGMSGPEQSWLESGLSQLNANIATQVNNAKINDPGLDVSLVDLSGRYGGTDVMYGHKWCDPDPYAYGMSLDYPLVDGSPAPNDNPAPFHPTPEGQYAIYQAVKGVLGGTSSALNPTADTYIDSGNTTTNHGGANPLWVTSSVDRGLMRFNTSGTVPSGNVVRGATLKLYVTNDAVTTGGFEVHPEGDSWTESGATWSNQPTWNSTVLATSATPAAGYWVSISLPAGAINASGNTSLGLRYTVANSNAQIASREDSSHKPQLIVDYSPPDPGTSTSNATADTYVDSGNTTTNYGSANPLKSTSSQYRSLLRFNTNGAVPSGNVVTGGILKMFVTNDSVTTGGFEVHPEDDSWTESGTTWSNQPTWNNTVLATSGTPTTGTWVPIALPANAINPAGNTSLGVRYTVANSSGQLASREDPTQQPQLMVTYASPATAAMTSNPTADTYVNSGSSGTNYGAASVLWATSAVTRSFLRFNTNGVKPDGYSIASVQLKIYVTNDSVSTGGFEIHPEDDSWGEYVVNWSNQPTWSSTVWNTSGTPTTGSWLTISVPTSDINNSGDTSLGLRYTDANSNATFASREDTAHEPQLVINLQRTN